MTRSATFVVLEGRQSLKHWESCLIQSVALHQNLLLLKKNNQVLEETVTNVVGPASVAHFENM